MARRRAAALIRSLRAANISPPEIAITLSIALGSVLALSPPEIEAPMFRECGQLIAQYAAEMRQKLG